MTEVGSHEPASVFSCPAFELQPAMGQRLRAGIPGLGESDRACCAAGIKVRAVRDSIRAPQPVTSVMSAMPRRNCREGPSLE